MRPTHSELNKKLIKARASVLAGDWSPVDPLKLTPEFHALKLYTTEEQTGALFDCLEEISPAHYKGAKPPQKSYERATKGKELFAFVWESARFKRRMYLKYCFRGETLYIVSLHRSKSYHADSGGAP